MSEKTLNLAAAIADRFQSNTRDELEAFAEVMEIKCHPNLKDENLRDRILDKLNMKLEAGQTVEVSADPNARPFEVRPPEDYTNKDINALMRLNLTPNGRWQGRRRRVSVPKPESMKGQAAHPWSWGRHQVMVPWNSPVDVPWPIFEQMKNTGYFEIEQERTTDRKGTPKIINHRVQKMRFSFADHGDSPGTESLPKSQKDQFRRVAEATDYFQGWSKTQLARLCRRLSLRYERGTDVEAIRGIALSALGFDPDDLDATGAGGLALPEDEAAA